MTTMRPVVRLFAALLVLAGGTFFLQGVGVLPGSFMTGRGEWAVIGACLVLAGLVIAWFAGTFRTAP
jgi:hypothetical protein